MNIDDLGTKIDKMHEDNTEQHGKLFDKLGNHAERITAVETRQSTIWKVLCFVGGLVATVAVTLFLSLKKGGGVILLVFLLAGCATTGTFSGVVKNPDGTTAYTIEGKTNSETTISPTFAGGFSVLGMSLSEVLLLVGIGGGAIGGGVYGKKKLDERKNGKKGK